VAAPIELDERVFFALLQGVDNTLLPNVPYAPDGQALYSRFRNFKDTEGALYFAE
jgi:hypothetical protein